MSDQVIKFSLQFDDEQHSLSAEHGLPIPQVADLLKALYAAIDPGDGTTCTLSEVRGNCYLLEISAPNEKWHTNFEVVHNRFDGDLQLANLSDDEEAYAKQLKVVLGGQYFVNALNKEKRKIAHIKPADLKLLKPLGVDSYYSTVTVSGRVSEIGGPKLTGKRHIKIDGFSHQITITEQQDAALGEYYPRSNKRVLSLRVRVRKWKETHKTRSVELLSFEAKAAGGFLENLTKIGPDLKKYFEGFKPLDDVG